jgi:hypothetical protein
MVRKLPDKAAETINRDQEDEGQNLGALLPDEADGEEVGESRRANRGNPADVIPDDTPDLVEKMEEMVRSGRIDSGAFAGEPSYDDEPEMHGDAAAAELEGDGIDERGEAADDDLA